MSTLEPLSVDDAVDALDFQDNDEVIAEEAPDTAAEEAVEPEEEIEAEVEEAEVDENAEVDPTEAEVEAEPEEDNGEDEEEASEEPEMAIDAPQFWDAGGKDAFAKLPRDAQQAVIVYEQQRNAVVSRKLNEVATERKVLEERVSGLDDFVSETDKQLEAFANVDWAHELKLVESGQAPMSRFTQAQAKFNLLKEQKEQATQAKGKAEFAAYQDHVKAEHEQLAEVAPHLAGATPEAVQKRTDVATYLQKQGIDAEGLKWIGASEMALAEKAMLYDRAHAKAKDTPKPKPVGSKQTVRGVKPGKAAAPVSPDRARRQKLASKGSLSLEEAMEFMD